MNYKLLVLTVVVLLVVGCRAHVEVRHVHGPWYEEDAAVTRVMARNGYENIHLVSPGIWQVLDRMYIERSRSGFRFAAFMRGRTARVVVRDIRRALPRSIGVAVMRDRVVLAEELSFREVQHRYQMPRRFHLFLDHAVTVKKMVKDARRRTHDWERHDRFRRHN